MSALLLKIAATRLRAIIDSLNSAVIVEDEHRRIVLVNQNFCDLFRLLTSPDALVGEDCSDSARQIAALLQDPSAFMTRVHELLSLLQPAFNDLIELKSGQILERDYIPIFHEDRFIGHLWHYRDVSEARRRAAALERAVEDARKADAAKDAFIAAVSHELRSPLQAVLGSTELLRERTSDPVSRELLHAILHASRALRSLIDDILDLSSLRAGAFALHPTTGDLHALLRNLHATFRATATSRNLPLLLSIDNALPSSVVADHQRLEQISTNLLANALRFTDRGQVELRASLLDQNGSQFTLSLEVLDTGIGIPPQDRERLFRPFHQATDPRHRRGGTGLGLAICNHLVQKMGGAIRYIPGDNGGSCFRVELPLVAADAPVPTAISHSSIPARRAAPRRVLVIEDNVANQIWARHALASRGYTVEIAEGGPQALELLRQGALFDAILTDWQMPVMDGLETTRAIRALGGPFERLPILGLSASTLPHARQVCLDAGMNDCLLKPVPIRTLVSTIEALLDAHAASSPPSPAPLPTPHPQAVHIEGLPPEVCLELAQIFHEHVLLCCQRLDEALSSGDLEATARHAHAIASSASGVQHTDLAHQAQDLERRISLGATLQEISADGQRLVARCRHLAPLLLEDTRQLCQTATTLPPPTPTATASPGC
jgi:two-component system sensor histidine kinase EvgS